MMESPMRIFLSSTYEDLTNYRNEVMDVIVGSENVYKGMEYFGASQDNSLNACLEQLENSNLVICIIGTRYGSCPAGSSKSYTEHEIDHAIEHRIPIWVYMLDEEEQPILKRFVETGQNEKKLSNLKDRLKKELKVQLFTEPKDLGIKIARDLYKSGTKLQRLANSITRRYRESAYDLLAEWYDDWYTGHWCGDKPYKTICSIVSSYLESSRGNLSGMTILDCACGTGNSFVPFTQDGMNIFGTDGSKEMLLRGKDNCASIGVSSDKLIMDPINWTDLDGYTQYFGLGYFDLIVNTANSFCHIPPIQEYMQTALSNFYQLLKPGGLLFIDTKRYIRNDPINKDVSTYRELKFDASEKEWIERYEREESRMLPDYGEVNFHTRLMYDTDPSFSIEVRRALIVITIYGGNLTPRTLVVPYYPLPATLLQEQMKQAGFKTTSYPAMEGLASDWKYDIVVGQKPMS